MTDTKILIIGAGLGGLELAHALSKNNIPFEIFERDQAAAGRKQGWAVSLAESVPLLEGVLSPESARCLGSVSVNHNTGSFDEFGVVDAKSGEIATKMGGKPFGQSNSFLRANREAFRSYVWSADNLRVTSGKQFTHYETDENGITAFFSDGSKTRGSFLVAADGSHSRVRQQLLNGSMKDTTNPSEHVPIFGEVDLPREDYEPVLKLGNAGILATGPGIRFFIGMLAMQDDKSSARFFYSFGVRSKEAQKLSDWNQAASKEERYEFVHKASQDVAPTLKRVIEFGGSEAILPHQPVFVEFVTPNELPNGRVALLGDAAHSMVPFKGAGANTAIVDAVDLAQLLVNEHRNGGTGHASITAEYNAKMIPRGQAAVISSRAGASAPMDDPFEFLKNLQMDARMKRDCN